MEVIQRSNARFSLHKTIITLLPIAFIASCSKPKPEPVWDATYNPERAKRGIPELPANWIRDDKVRGGEQKWVPFVSLHGAAGHAMKIIEGDAGVIYSEYDFFASGKTYPNPDPDNSNEQDDEGLNVTYSYDAERKGQNPWHFVLNSKDYAGGKEVSRSEANSLLQSWHLPPI